MSKRRAIGRALTGFADMYLPAMQAMQDRRYREALTDRARAEADAMIRSQGALNLLASGAVDDYFSQTPGTGESPEVEVLAAEPGGVMLAALQRDPPSADEFFGGVRLPLPDEAFSPEGHTSLDPGSPEGRESLIGRALEAQGGLTTPPPISAYDRLMRRPSPGDPDYFEGGVEQPLRLVGPPPPQFDEGERQIRQWAAGMGVPPAQIDALRGPEVENPAFTRWQDVSSQIFERAIDIVTAAPTEVTYTDADGHTVKESVNMMDVMHPWAREFLVVNGWKQLDRPSARHSRNPQDQLDAPDANEQMLERGVGSSNEVAERARAGFGSGPNGVLAALQNESKLGVPQAGAYGGSAMVQLSADQQKHLMQLIPLFGVTEQIIDLARSLNDEEIRWMAMVDRIQEEAYARTGLWKDKPVTGYIAGAAADERTDATLKRIEDIAAERGAPVDTDRVRLLSRLRNAFAGLYAELGGERGRKTEDDVRRALQMIPGVGSTRGETLQMSKTILDHLIGTYYGIVRGPLREIPIDSAKEMLGNVNAAMAGRPVPEGLGDPAALRSK
jgi:hypothetical protein